MLVSECDITMIYVTLEQLGECRSKYAIAGRKQHHQRISQTENTAFSAEANVTDRWLLWTRIGK
jgi:hypothetical protein